MCIAAEDAHQLDGQMTLSVLRTHGYKMHSKEIGGNVYVRTMFNIGQG